MTKARGNGSHEPASDTLDKRIVGSVVEHRQLAARIRSGPLTDLDVLRRSEAVLM